MRRPVTRGLLLTLFAAGAGVAVGAAAWPPAARPDLEYDGGTVLVYEVDLERAREAGPADAPPGGLSDAEIERLAAQLKRRIDPADLRGVAARPVGGTRVEIVLPAAAPADVDEVKRLVSQAGVLEFRILANGRDDAAGVAAARAAVDGKSPKETRARGDRGLPPEGPAGEFEVTVGDATSRARYAWVELGPEERASLRLSGRDEGPGGLWAEAARLRGRTFAVRSAPDGYAPTADPAAADLVLFSRECTSLDQLAREKADPRAGRKGVDYFVLTRVSPDDGLRVGGEVTLTAAAGTDANEHPSVDFTLGPVGAERFGRLTRRNKPSGDHVRRLAVILDGRVVTAPTLRSEIGARGQITGVFDREAVDRQVQILRSGALPVELRDRPVSEVTVGPVAARPAGRPKAVAVALGVGAAAATGVLVGLVWRWAT